MWSTLRKLKSLKSGLSCFHGIFPAKCTKPQVNFSLSRSFSGVKYYFSVPSLLQLLPQEEVGFRPELHDSMEIPRLTARHSAC